MWHKVLAPTKSRVGDLLPTYTPRYIYFYTMLYWYVNIVLYLDVLKLEP